MTNSPAPEWRDRPGVHFEGPQHLIEDVEVVVDLPPAPPGQEWAKRPVTEQKHDV